MLASTKCLFTGVSVEIMGENDSAELALSLE